jgi:hypothetical protein
MPEFKSQNSYARFRREVEQQRRFVRTAEAEAFLRTVASTCGTRIRPMREGMRLWRAQLDHRYEVYRGWEVAVPCAPDRMKPLRDSAIEGRANPKGIPCLYLSTAERAACQRCALGSAQWCPLRNSKRCDH